MLTVHLNLPNLVMETLCSLHQRTAGRLFSDLGNTGDRSVRLMAKQKVLGVLLSFQTSWLLESYFTVSMGSSGHVRFSSVLHSSAEC